MACIATALTYAGYAATAYTAYTALSGSGNAPDSGPIPTAPGNDPAAEAARAQVAEDERRRRIGGSRESTNPTGGLGDTSAPMLASKSLLGL